MRISLFFVCLLSFIYSNAQHLPVSSKNNFRIVFLGNSITYAGYFTAEIETYYRLKYPANKIEFINLGLPSETVSGLSEEGHAQGNFPRPFLFDRFERTINQTRPDLIISCYGMNDGIYLPLDTVRFKRFQAGIQKLQQEADRRSIELVHLTPPIYDPIKGEAYAHVLDVYTKWLLSQRKLNWKVIDIHNPMKQELHTRRNQDPTFIFAQDGIHPDEFGHWIIAKNILIGLGEIAIESSVSFEDFYQTYPNGEKIQLLIRNKQSLLKDAWLCGIGHQRPNMKQGLPLKEAITQTDLMQNQILELVE
ncbi:SGNH/GDSL hydrolase family protein [Reichenbachiella carrageenanivorans]|uniref:SGNH/GDSL hydrolase family protein n=1 Tax=Reichenbachiella carrageenanivorans TaxID=2979869 RepID=A0ABY6D0Y9_9BACT|nr:SGNH/GDSL hydrolase family protein [Reichenbachiella carrageenanivorans]UXX79844.1 SGNH/GDSL hydrolase family protein [Reichenbachiella carrageenanivorans]